MKHYQIAGRGVRIEGDILIIELPNIPYLRELLKKAVEEERYEDAAKLRDDINRHTL